MKAATFYVLLVFSAHNHVSPNASFRLKMTEAACHKCIVFLLAQRRREKTILLSLKYTQRFAI